VTVRGATKHVMNRERLFVERLDSWVCVKQSKRVELVTDSQCTMRPIFQAGYLPVARALERLMTFRARSFPGLGYSISRMWLRVMMSMGLNIAS